MTASFACHRMDANIGSSPRKLGECRICQDEDEESNMEVPCFCRGSLKYAHRKCVQRWCNEKGDTICEICHQLFKPGYTPPPPLYHYSGIPMNFRGNWEISRRDLQNLQFLTMDSTNGNFLDPDVDDYPVPTSRSVICCRIITIIVLRFIIAYNVVVLSREKLGSDGNLYHAWILIHSCLLFLWYYVTPYHSSFMVLLVILRTIGILLPIYVMVKALTAIQRRRNQQDSPVFPLATSDEENELPQQPQAHVIHVP